MAGLADAPEEAATFFWRHAVPVAGMAFRRTGEIETALDVTAETFAVALMGAAHFRGPDSARGWLFAIAGRKLAEAGPDGAISDRGRRALGIPPRTRLADAERDEASTELWTRFGGSSAALVADLPASERDAALVWSGCRASGRPRAASTHAPGSMPWSGGLLSMLGELGDHLAAACVRRGRSRTRVGVHVRRAVHRATARLGPSP